MIPTGALSQPSPLWKCFPGLQRFYQQLQIPPAWQHCCSTIYQPLNKRYQYFSPHTDTTEVGTPQKQLYSHKPGAFEGLCGTTVMSSPCWGCELAENVFT